ncbi:MAG: hypothetical protein QM820_46525 [Minicystis sp.]
MTTIGKRWLCGMLAALALAGCSGEVLVMPGGAAIGTTGGGAATGGGGAVSSGGAGGCGGEVATAELRWPTSGTFVNGYLHVAARIDGAAERYHVLQLAGGEAYVVDTVEALAGPAKLARVWDPALYARLRADGASTSVDVVDATDPAHPVLQESRTVPGIVPEAWRGEVAVIAGHALYCAAPSAGEEAVLTSVDVLGDGAPAPIAPEPEFDQICGGLLAHVAGAAFGTTWVAWGAESDLAIFGVTTTTSTHVADYYYNPDGVHHYGNVLSAASDGSRIVFDPSNDAEFFLYEIGSGLPYTTHAYFGGKGPKRLLAVAGQIAYLASAKGVHAYDVADIDNPKLIDFHADADFGEGLATLVAADETQLAVTDAAGRLYVIPLGGSGTIAPITVHPGPPPASGGCAGKGG